VIQISNSIEIARPVLQVFNYVANVENNPNWMPVQSVQRISQGATAKGTHFKQQFHLLGANYEMDCVITAFEANKKISFEYDAPVFKWRGDYLFVETPKGTRLSAKGNITLGGPLKMAETMFAPKIRKLINDTAPKLKQILES
jgi:carbon monoxide dehydrogenase subunit G